MLLTEKQARETLCHRMMERRFDFRKAATGNPAGSHCIASECMAWRWGEYRVLRSTGEPLETGKAYVSKAIETRTDRGYCGLAGKPA